MTSSPRELARELLERAAGRELLTRWSGASASEGVDLLQQTVLALLHDHPRLALDAVEHVLQATPQQLSPTMRARLERLHAHALKANGEIAGALRSYQSCHESFVEEGEVVEIARTAIGWADGLALSGDFAKARRVLDKAEKALPRKTPELRARLLGVRATVEYTAGAYDEAARLNRNALARARRRGQDVDAAICRYNLANIDLVRGRAKAARKLFERSRAEFEERSLAVGIDQCRYGLAAVDLLEGEWRRGLAELREVRQSLEQRGDLRGGASVAVDMARLLISAGATKLAEEPARSARRMFADLGLRPQQARACELHARILVALRRHYDASRRFDEAQTLYQMLGRRDRVWSLRASRLELMSQRAGGIDAEFDRQLRGIAAHARRKGDTDLQLRCDALRLVALTQRGRQRSALRLANDLHARCRQGGALLRRPTLALSAAEAASALGEGTDSLAWVRRALADLERVENAFGESAAAGLAQLREEIAGRATSIVLRHGGPRGPQKALEILLRVRARGVVEDLLRGHMRNVDRSTRDALARLRDQLLDLEADGDDVRGRAIRREVSQIEKRWSRPRPTSVHGGSRVLDQCRVSEFRDALGSRALVVLDRSAEGWQALVLEPQQPCRHVPLPDLAEALRRHWTPTRMLFEAIARAPRQRRRQLLARSEEEARRNLHSLGAALWTPLELSSDDVLVVPCGVLHALPLEAMRCETSASLGSVHRIPHPGLLEPRSGRRPRHALLLEGTVPGAAREVSLVRHELEEGGWRATVARDRQFLQADDTRLGLLHVAAHGSYHRSDWLANGLRLRDGWLGFEQLSPSQVRGALLFFDSCESGLPQEVPTTELDGWATAGFAAGAGELVLTLWKVDDDSATAFARSFYRRFRGDSSAPRAAHQARLERRRQQPHPYHWGAHVVASRR